MDHRTRTTAFFARWAVSFDEMCASFEAVLAPDGVWDQRPMARTTGPAEALRFLRLCRRTLGLATIEVDVLSLAVNDNVVHTERVDHLRRADGGLIASAPVAGVLTWRGGELVHWREYFDAASLASRAAGSGLVAAGSGLVAAGSTALGAARRLTRRG